MNWVIILLALSFVIFIHELGHYLAAKYCGVGVDEFSIGMGPKVWGFVVAGTLYSIRLLPLGGFVKLAGLDSSDGVPDALNYRLKSLGSRLLIIVAGPVMNILLGWIVFSIIFVGYGRLVMGTEVTFIKPGSPAMLAGFSPGDRLVSVAGHTVTDVKRDVIRVIRHSHGKPVVIGVEREGHLTKLVVTPSGKVPQIGVAFGGKLKTYSFFGGILEGGVELGRQVQMIGTTIQMLVSGEAGVKELAGPIGIMQLASSGLKAGLMPFLGIMGMISVSLGVMNLLPLPVLDGGHIFFLLIEKLRGKPLSEKTEGYIMTFGIVLLVGLMVLTLGNDILQWKSRFALLKGMK